MRKMKKTGKRRKLRRQVEKEVKKKEE